MTKEQSDNGTVQNELAALPSLMEDVSKLKKDVAEIIAHIGLNEAAFRGLDELLDRHVRVTVSFYDHVLRLLAKVFPDEYPHLKEKFPKDHGLPVPKQEPPLPPKEPPEKKKNPVEVMYG